MLEFYKRQHKRLKIELLRVKKIKPYSNCHHPNPLPVGEGALWLYFTTISIFPTFRLGSFRSSKQSAWGKVNTMN